MALPPKAQAEFDTLDRLVRDHRLPHGAVRLFMLLYRVAKKGGLEKVELSQDAICREIRADFESVVRWVRSLVECGYVGTESYRPAHQPYSGRRFFFFWASDRQKPTDADRQKPTDADRQKPTDADRQKPTDADRQKPTDADRQKPITIKKGIGGKGGGVVRGTAPPSLAAQGKGTTAAAPPIKELPPFQSKLPMPEKANGVPKFAPLPAHLYPRELAEMLADARAALKKAKADPANLTRVLRKDVADLVADYVENKRPRAAERVAQLKADPRNWTATGFTEHGQRVLEAWRARIAEVERRKLGVTE